MRLAAFLFVNQIQVSAWTMHPHGLMSTCVDSPFTLMTKKSQIDSKLPTSSESDFSSPEPEWGKSYIGGDPCGSRYNDDPFDAASVKPGLPDDMKERIKALAEQKLKDSCDG